MSSRVTVRQKFLFVGLILFSSNLCAIAADPAKQPSFTVEQLEFFEKQVRPLLVQRCYACHSAKSKKLKANLRLDSRTAVLRGGDTGPAAVAGNPAKSLLVDAINYGDTYQMPPSTRLPKKEIAVLTRWVKMGLPWPAEKPLADTSPTDAFDLAARRQSHWSWQPVKRPTLPSVKRSNWPRDDLDHFVLAKLEQQELSPAPPADRRQLIRRLYLDLVGLPPTILETEAFVADASPKAYEKLVDRLLDSPHFGERWGRHWLDLVRYAESRGHEFDYSAANVFQYRDYVIRALNADIPYDQFIREHLAGDLLKTPRTHPTEGFNESILGTGFWFLGEWVHSPVDIRQDELDRYDNMIDVMSKTFLGLTVSCARCHDHKFDAISQRDYYALTGYLQSSSYRQARFDTLNHNRQIAEQLHALHQESDAKMASAVLEAQEPILKQLSEILLFVQRTHVSLPKATSPPDRSDLLFMDFESGSYKDWKTTGTAFGDRPNSQATIAKYQGDVNGQGRYFVNSHNPHTEKSLQHSDKPQGTLTSPDFPVSHQFIRLLVGGGAHAGKTCVNLRVDGRVVASLTGKNSNQMTVQWLDVGQFKSKTAKLEIVDRHSGGWGNIGIDHIVFTDKGPANSSPTPSLTPQQRDHILQAATDQQLPPKIALAWFEYLIATRGDPFAPFYLWSKLALTGAPQAPTADRIEAEVANWLDKFSAPYRFDPSVQVLVNYDSLPPGHFKNNGFGFGLQPLKRGAITWTTNPATPIEQVVAHSTARRDPSWSVLTELPGQAREPGALGKYVRAGQTHRTPTFTVGQGSVHILLRGSGHIYAAVDSHAVIQGPLHKALTREFKEPAVALQWVTLNLAAYRGHRAHLEITGTGPRPTEILYVVEAPRAPPLPSQLANPLHPVGTISSLKDLALSYQRGLLAAANSYQSAPDKLTAPTAATATWINRHGELFYLSDKTRLDRLQQVTRPLLASRQDLLAKIRRPSRLAPAMLDGTADNEFLLIRGNHKTTNGTVPRRFLEALGGTNHPAHSPGSGRLQLADEILKDSNPYPSRVMVNRIWHHLFGRGIVPSTNNFGILGQRPTHPLLLDHLADGFVRDGWSVKRMIKRIVLSQTYLMSSKVDLNAQQRDPTNRWLHHKSVRRLEGEIIRDQLLALSGQLDRKLYGPSVPIFLTEFMQGRGRPRSGPLDGQGRRSIYLSVRRNFLHPLLLTFDMPIPFNSMGRRNVSNVPAQALILMNDPFVIAQSELWAKKLLEDPRWKDLSPAQRIDARLRDVYLATFARPPTATESQHLKQFIRSQANALKLPDGGFADDLRLWKDLVHIVINTKEFIFIE